jgi:hypothetical protein
MRIQLAMFAVLALPMGCTDSDDGPSDAGVDGGDAGCMATAEVNLVFYENVCVGTWVQCDGEAQEPMPGDRGGSFCDLEEIGCDSPDRSQTAIRSYVPSQRGCEVCTEADRDQRCTPLPAGCGSHTVEHVASGSEETGTRPLFGQCDGGIDDDAGN